MIIHAEPRFVLMTGKGEMKTVVAEKLRQEFIALRVVHGAIEQHMRQPRCFRQYAGDIGVAGRQFLGHDAGSERIGAGTS